MENKSSVNIQNAGEARWKHLLFLSALIALVILTASLRLCNIDWLSINNDEAFTIWLSRQDVSNVLEYTTFGGKDVNTPPLHYLIVHAIIKINEQPLTVRLPSIISGVIMVILTAYLAYELFGARAALLSAFLITIAPYHIAISRIGRAHALGSMIILVSTCFFMRILFKKPRWFDWIGIVISSALAKLSRFQSPGSCSRTALGFSRVSPVVQAIT